MSKLPWARRQFSLTQRAILTLIGNLLVQAAEFITGFFITPFIIRGLGQELYGAWGMIQQVLAYFSMTDFRGPTTLRFLLSLQQHDENPTSKQRLIGATLILWGISLPLTAAIGIALVYFSPVIIRSSPLNQAPIRIALAVLLTNSVIDRVLTIPMNVLYAQNIYYVGMGINTMTVLGGSILSGAAIWFGFGLPGLAVATMVNILLISIGRIRVVKNALPWMAIKLPGREFFFKFLKTSAFLFFSGFGSMMTYSTGTLLVGWILGPANAAVYVTSGMVMSMIGEPIYQLVSAGNTGLMGLCAQKNWERVAVVRQEMYFIQLFFITVLGTGIIALNGPFLSLWVGHQFFGGSILTIGIVLSMSLTFLSRIDLMITDAMLFLKEKAWAFFTAGLLVIISAPLFLNLWGISGIIVSSISSNILLLFVAWILIHKRMGVPGLNLLRSLIRPMAIMAFLFILAFNFGVSIKIESWAMFGFYTCGIGIFAMTICWFLAVPKAIQDILISRIKQMIQITKER